MYFDSYATGKRIQQLRKANGMTQEEMAKFIKMQLNDGASWTIESQAASGTGDTQACYSSGDQPLYVMWPDEAVVQSISAKMNEILNGN